MAKANPTSSTVMTCGLFIGLMCTVVHRVMCSMHLGTVERYIVNYLLHTFALYADWPKIYDIILFSSLLPSKS